MGIAADGRSTSDDGLDGKPSAVGFLRGIQGPPTEVVPSLAPDLAVQPMRIVVDVPGASGAQLDMWVQVWVNGVRMEVPGRVVGPPM